MLDNLENPKTKGSVDGENTRGQNTGANQERNVHRNNGGTPIGHFNQGDQKDVALRSVKIEASQFDGKLDPKCFLDWLSNRISILIGITCLRIGMSSLPR